MGALLHLCKRFLGSIRPGGPGPDDERWARGQLLPGEQLIWDRMNNPDRRHAITVARAVEAAFEARNRAGAGRTVLAAALLHDSGKVVSNLRTPARVAATVLWAVADDAVADRWMAESQPSLRRRLGQYRRHPRLGSELLQAAGSDPLTSNWAAEHHRPPNHWSVPADVGRILKACDDD